MGNSFCYYRLERELGNCQIDVRDMGSRTKRVAAATEEALNLLEPRENAFLKLHTETNKLLHGSYFFILHLSFCLFFTFF